MSLAAKTSLLQQVDELLSREITTLEAAAQAAHDAATDEEAKPENQYDTRALEASYLAGAQKERLAELRAALALLRATQPRTYGPADKIGATALVELEHEGTRSLCFILAQGAGLPLMLDGRPVMAITGQSPLGRALLGRVEGELVSVRAGGGEKEYEIVGVS